LIVDLSHHSWSEFHPFDKDFPLFSIENLISDIPPGVLGWVTGLSIATFIGSLIVVPIIAARIPADYFDDTRRREAVLHRMHPVIYFAVRILKNMLAVVLIAGGILMLVLPGQGILTILIGIGISDFPGKYRLERKLVCLPGILTAINWIRSKAKIEPLRPPLLE
jgi:hypothetical protein